MLDIKSVTRVEFTFGQVTKRYPQEVSYNKETGVFTVTFSYEEATQFLGFTQCQARTVFFNGDVKGTNVYYGNIADGNGHMGKRGRAPTIDLPYSVEGCCGVSKNGKRLVSGDTYQLPIIVKYNGKPININEVSSIEFLFDGLRKIYPENVSYEEKSGTFVVPLTQRETFAFRQNMEYKALVHFVDGKTEDTDIYVARVEQSLSGEVL